MMAYPRFWRSSESRPRYRIVLGALAIPTSQLSNRPVCPLSRSIGTDGTWVSQRAGSSGRGSWVGCWVLRTAALHRGQVLADRSNPAQITSCCPFCMDLTITQAGVIPASVAPWTTSSPCANGARSRNVLSASRHVRLTTIWTTTRDEWLSASEAGQLYLVDERARPARQHRQPRGLATGRYFGRPSLLAGDIP